MSIDKIAMKEIQRIIQNKKDYENYEPHLTDEEFTEAWNKACKKVKEGLKC